VAGKRRDPRDLDDEIRAHIALEEDDLRQAGVAAAEAHRRARVTFGNPSNVRERISDAARLGWLATVVQDFRYGVRLLGRRPAFSVAAALVLALGIGATTALFSVVNGLFNRPLGVADPERLFYLYSKNWSGQVGHYLAPAEREFFANESRDLADYTSHWLWPRVRLVIDQENQFLAAGMVESNFFSIAGVEMVRGRPFRPEDDDPANTERSMVISHDLWLTRFQGEEDIVGRRVQLVRPDGGRQEFRIVGVAAAGFRGLSDPLTPVQCWVTGAQVLDFARGSGVGNYGHGPVGRLKPGASLAQMRALIAARTPVLREELFNRLSASYRVANPDWPRRASYEVHGALSVQVPRDPTAWLVEPNVLIAMGVVVSMVLVIATANIAGLLVAHGIGRSSEIAVRRALGAGGSRLVRQVLTETIALAALGGLAGGVIAIVCVSVFRAFAPPELVAGAIVDWRVLIFAASVSIGTGIVVGVMPALQALRVSVLESLGAGVVGSRRAGVSVGRWVLVPQVALALLLLVVASVHVRAIVLVTLTDPGFRAQGAQTFAVVRTEPYPTPGRNPPEVHRALSAEWWTRTWRFNYDLVTKLEAVSAIPAFGVTSSLPVGGWAETRPIASEESRLQPEDGKAAAKVQVVSNGYFDAIGTRILAGRSFGPGDVANSLPVAVVSEALARTLWPEGSPLGKRLAEPAAAGREIVWREVVGVAAEIDPIFKPKGQEPRLYVPLGQSVPLANVTVVARTVADEAGSRSDIRAAILGSDTTAEITQVKTMNQVLDEYLYPRRLGAAILVAAGVIGLVLAAVGLYGVVAYSAAQRLRELGIRSTLGAGPLDLIRLLVREAAVVAALGGAVGLGLSWVAVRATAGMYPDLPMVDTVSFIGAPAVLALVVLAACLIPARRAVASGPAHALRAE
jgi:predicted permease